MGGSEVIICGAGKTSGRHSRCPPENSLDQQSRESERSGIYPSQCHEQLLYRQASASSLAVPPPPPPFRKWSFTGSGCAERNLGVPGSGPATARRARAVPAPARGAPGPGVAMTSELDIFVGNTTLIDEDVYRLWLDGYSGLWGSFWGNQWG